MQATVLAQDAGKSIAAIPNPEVRAKFQAFYDKLPATIKSQPSVVKSLAEAAQFARPPVAPSGTEYDPQPMGIADLLAASTQNGRRLTASYVASVLEFAKDVGYAANRINPYNKVRLADRQYETFEIIGAAKDYLARANLERWLNKENRANFVSALQSVYGTRYVTQDKDMLRAVIASKDFDPSLLAPATFQRLTAIAKAMPYGAVRLTAQVLLDNRAVRDLFLRASNTEVIAAMQKLHSARESTEKSLLGMFGGAETIIEQGLAWQIVSGSFFASLNSGKGLLAAANDASKIYEAEKSRIAEFARTNKRGSARVFPQLRQTMRSSVGSVVQQGEAVIFEPSSSSKAVYTSNALHCTIAVAVKKDSSGKTERVGMAHIDPNMPDAEVERFFKAVSPDGKLEISLVSGDFQNGLRMYHLAKAHGSVKVVDCDIDGERADALTVSGTGTIYRGRIAALDNLMKTSEIDDKRMSSQQWPLTIRDLSGKAK